MDAGQSPDRKFRVRFIETSSPGLAAHVATVIEILVDAGIGYEVPAD